MGLVKFNYRSEVLGGYVSITIALPTDEFSYLPPEQRTVYDHVEGKVVKDGYEPGMKFQTVYLLHGGGDDDSLTYRYTNAERYAQKNKVMLVTPNIMNSFGADTRYNVKYSTFVGCELPKVVQALFPSSTAREDNFIAGYAMGANAALGNALLHPDQFCRCVDMSGGIGFTLDTEKFSSELASDHFKNNFKLYGSTFGTPEGLEESEFNIYRQAVSLKESGKELPIFHFMAGSEEGLIRERVEGDESILRGLGYETSLEIFDGMKHNFDLWDITIRHMLEDVLPLKRSAIYPGENR